MHRLLKVVTRSGRTFSFFHWRLFPARLLLKGKVRGRRESPGEEETHAGPGSFVRGPYRGALALDGSTAGRAGRLGGEGAGKFMLKGEPERPWTLRGGGGREPPESNPGLTGRCSWASRAPGLCLEVRSCQFKAGPPAWLPAAGMPGKCPEEKGMDWDGGQRAGSQREAARGGGLRTGRLGPCRPASWAQQVRVQEGSTQAMAQVCTRGSQGGGGVTGLSPCQITLFGSVQSLSRVRLCDPMNHSTPGLPVHRQLPEFTQTHVHRVRDAIQPPHPLVPFSSCPQSFPASESFPVSQLFA